MSQKTKAERKSRAQIILKFLEGSKRYFAIAILASILTTFFNFMTPQVFRITVDSVIGDSPFDLPDFLLRFVEFVGGRDALRNNLILCASFILAFAVLSGFCNFASRVSTSKGTELFILRLRNKLYDHIQRLSYSWHVHHQTGDIIQRCTSDVDVVRNFVSGQLLEVFRTSFLIIFALGIMFTMNVKMTLIALVFMPIILSFSGIYFSKISKRFKVADEAEGALFAGVQENLTGVRVVRAFGRERYEIDRFDEKNTTFADLWIRLGKLMSTYWGLGDLLSGLQILTVLVFGTIEAVNGNITLGEFLVFISYNSTLIWPIRGLGRILSEMSKAGVSIDRINYILNAEEEQDVPNASTPPLNGDISFNHITYQYEGTKPVLKDINFTIKAGTTFGILGGTGSGKSTLMHLLNRLYDLPEENGSIKIGGVNINDMKRSWVRSNIGMVLQEPFLFSRTIRENISAFRPDADIQEIRRSAEIACVDDAVNGFTNGYDTIVGERGVTLSGGQKQRVAIARMLMQKAPIMVFDDSLSAVDSETDAKIRAALKDNLGQSTVILISHRITTLMQADLIMVMEDGKIVQMGTHDQLIHQSGTYKDIYDIQLNSDDRISTFHEKEVQ